MSDTRAELRRHDPLYVFSHWGLWVLIAVGAAVRFWQLGRWPLAEDEYYLVQSVHNILVSGLPRFECGGFYPRGVIQQYVTAGLIQLGLQTELALRAPTVIANLAGIPAVYALGRRLGGWVVACTAAALFCLSAWEIEFARFGRMYAPFQTLFLWYVVFLIQATIDGKRRARLWMYGLSAAGLLTYAGAIFMIVLNAVPFILRKSRPRLADLATNLVLFGAAVAIRMMPFRDLGVAVSRIPPDVAELTAGADGGLPVLLPKTLVVHLLSDGVWLLWSLLPMTLVLIALTRLWRSPGLPLRVRFTWAVLLGLSVFHLFGFVLGLAVLAELFGWLRPQRGVRPPDSPWRIVAGAIMLCAVFWVIFAVATDAWSGVQPPSSTSLWSGLMGLFLKYPDVYWAFLVPWSRAVPFLTVLVVGVVGMGLVWVLLRPAAEGSVSRLIYSVLIASLMMVSITNRVDLTTRYSFFLYPILLVLACTTLWQMARGILSRTLWQILAFCGAIALIVHLAEDFSFYHLRHIGDRDINFRMIYEPVRHRHYYQRYDYRGAAEYVSSRAMPQDVVISLIPVVDYYLHRLDYRFVGYDEEDFPALGACAGTREIWSNARLIYRVEDLFEQLESSPEGTIWVIALSGKENEVDRRLHEEYWDMVTRAGIDERILVYRSSDRS